jgi:3-hydroxyisobutyrate dehydrogenase-like beta-hydroxyacid dehydrogenase
MATLAFCGLGLMGGAMAARLIEAGHDLTVWNRTPAKAEPLVALGARAAATPAEAVAVAEAAITMLADPPALEEVVFGPSGHAAAGLAAGLAAGAVLIDMSTLGPDAIRRVAARLGEGVAVMDAPVLGSVPQVRQGTLKIFVGGPEGLLERNRSVLEALGTPFHVGPLGSGQSMKLVANSTLGSLMTTLGEALALAQGLGIERSKVFDVLVNSPIGVTASGKRPLVESGTYPPNFKLALAVKDLNLILAAAAGAGIELRVAEAARSWFAEALSEGGEGGQGLADLDYSAVIARITGTPAALPA